MKLWVKIALATVTTAGVGAGVWYLFNRNKKPKTLKIQLVRSNLSGVFDRVIIKIPATTLAFYKDSERQSIRNRMAEIKSMYGAVISNTANLIGIPEAIIYSFIFIESRGEKTAQNGLSYGLMQVSTNSATDILHLANKGGHVTGDVKTILRKHLGSRLDTILKMQYMNQYGLQVTESDLIKPELNILIGTLYLRLLIDYFTENKRIRLDKVVACYNMGFGWRTKLMQPNYDTIEKTIANLNSTTSSYILKLLGKNGTLDILTQ